MKFIEFFNEIKTKKPAEEEIVGSVSTISKYPRKDKTLFVKKFDNYVPSNTIRDEKLENFLREYFGYVILKTIGKNFRFMKFPKKIAFKFEPDSKNPGSFSIELISSGSTKGVDFASAATPRAKNSEVLNYFKKFFKMNYLIPNFIISNPDLHDFNFIGYKNSFKGYQIDPGIAFVQKENVSNLKKYMFVLFSDEDKSDGAEDYAIHNLEKLDPKLYKKIVIMMIKWKKYLDSNPETGIRQIVEKHQKMILSKLETVFTKIRVAQRKAFEKHIADNYPDPETSKKAIQEETALFNASMASLNKSFGKIRSNVIFFIQDEILETVLFNIDEVRNYFKLDNFSSRIYNLNKSRKGR